MKRRTLVVLSWTLVVLIASDRLLSLTARKERESSSRLRRLVPAVLDEKQIAAIRVEDAAQGDVLLAWTSSGWRSVSHWGAPVDEALLQNAVSQLLDAQGIARPCTYDGLEAYGLAPAQRLRVSLHGPRMLQARDHDLIAVIDIGRTIAGGRGTYARYGASCEVIAIDDDLRKDFVSVDGRSLTALIDPRIVPGAWSAGARIQRVEVRPERDRPFELRLRARKVQREELLAGVLPWDWLLVRDGPKRLAPLKAANAFVNFIQQARYSAPIDPRPRPALGLDPPRAGVVLHPAEGRVVEIQLGALLPGGVVIRNTLTQSVFVVESHIAALLVPRVDAFRRNDTNVWDPVLPQLSGVPGPATRPMPAHR